MVWRIMKHLCTQDLFASHGAVITNARYGHTMRGKPPGIAKTLAQRLAAEKVIDPEISEKMNIGFPHPRQSRSTELRTRLAHVKSQRQNPVLEQLARSQTLTINLDDVKAEYHKTSGPFHLRRIAEHYGVFEHLFGDAYFIPRILLDIKFENNDQTYTPVYCGNLIRPADAENAPIVHFDSHHKLPSSDESLWTLVMTNPDGHFTQHNHEYVHWMVSNIPNGELTRGDCIVPYLQPFPAKGTGNHRHIFILYKQETRIDMHAYKVESTDNLVRRTFSTSDFYRKFEDVITPAGLAFFQSSWDPSLTQFYHNVLEMKEPMYEYDFPKSYIKDPTWFPLRQPFNLYMDKYRDPKRISKEYLERQLAKTHPFNGPDVPLEFPNAHPIKNMPSWLKTEKKKDRLGWGRINDL